MAYAGGPYLLISHVPWLNVLAIWFVASQVALFYRLSGTGDIELGETWVETTSGKVTWDEWDGNRWFSADTIGEFPFQTGTLNMRLRGLRWRRCLYLFLVCGTCGAGASAKIRVSGGVYQHERPRNGTVIRTDPACRAGR